MNFLTSREDATQASELIGRFLDSSVDLCVLATLPSSHWPVRDWSWHFRLAWSIWTFGEIFITRDSFGQGRKGACRAQIAAGCL